MLYSLFYYTFATLHDRLKHWICSYVIFWNIWMAPDTIASGNIASNSCANKYFHVTNASVTIIFWEVLEGWLMLSLLIEEPMSAVRT